MFESFNVLFWRQILAILVCSTYLNSAADLTSFQVMQLCIGKYLNIIAYPSEPSRFIVCLNDNTKVGVCRTDKDAQGQDIPTCFNEQKQTCGLDFCTQTKADSDYEKYIKSYCRDDANLFRHLPAEDCENFFICLGSQTDAVKETCPNGQHFSRSSKTCQSPLEANCQSLDSMCTGKSSGYRFASKNCYDYYECKDSSEPITKSCPYGEHFDSSNQQCIQATKSQCIDTTNREPICELKDNGLYFGHHSQCDRFYVCINKVAFEGQCSQDYYFDTASRSCKKDTKGVCHD